MSIFLLNSIKGPIIRYKDSRLNIGQPGFCFIVIFCKSKSSWSFIFFEWLLALIIIEFQFLENEIGLQTTFCLNFNSFLKYFIPKV